MSEKGVKIADEDTKVRYVLAGWQRQGDYKTNLLQVKMEMEFFTSSLLFVICSKSEGGGLKKVQVS